MICGYCTGVGPGEVEGSRKGARSITFVCPCCHGYAMWGYDAECVHDGKHTAAERGEE